MISQLDQELEARLSAAFVRAGEQDWEDVRARAMRGGEHRTGIGRRRVLAACGVAALLAVTATAALARGWIFDSAPTLATVNQVTPTTPTDVEFGAIIRTGQLKNPVEQPGSMLFPAGSIYAGTLVRRADGDGGFTCVAALDGQSCGPLSATNPVIGGVLVHPKSTLPPLAYGAVAQNVASVSIECANGTFMATIIAGRVYTAVLPMSTNPDTCSTHWTLQ